MKNMNNIVTQLIEKRQWWDLVYLFRRLWYEDGDLYHRRQKNAVACIIQEYENLSGQKIQLTLRTCQRVATYVDRVGVAALIDDMHEAFKKHKPKSIFYFIHRADGQSSRWEMLVMDEINKEAAEEKASFNQIADELNLIVGKKVEPSWVRTARGKLKHLRHQLQRKGGIERIKIQNHINAIESRLINQGFKIKEDVPTD